ncbi:glycosyltransferase family 4 protein [Anoxybacteroides tepidamans]|uniref:glycosyltransferase family 4 protein n=1 Tax=Anoxybacteroides tepidamans TaxID=265948 RepID=UPI0004860ADB|nr:glycosyltransferase family 4 protein [Anoxybacillus tepidamans]
MKVLHLPYGGQMITLCAALREIGIEATSCHFRRSNFQFQPDICLDLQKISKSDHESVKREFFEQAVKEFDVFHFHFGMTFFDDHSDLEYLKKLGKKIIVQHRGSDVRRLSIARKLGNPYVRVKYPNEKRIVAELQKLSSFIDHAIVADYELLPYVQDFYKYVHIIRQAIDLKKFAPVYPSDAIKTPVIVHAPSHPVIKGTMYVQNAIKMLTKKGYPVDFQLLRKVPHEEALRMYERADIIIDQMCIGSFGILSLEGMALGKPVVCHIREGLVETYPEGLPIVNASPKNLYEKLKELVEHPEQLQELGMQGREYVEKHHDASVIAKQLANLYQQL